MCPIRASQVTKIGLVYHRDAVHPHALGWVANPRRRDGEREDGGRGDRRPETGDGGTGAHAVCQLCERSVFKIGQWRCILVRQRQKNRKKLRHSLIYLG